MNRDNTPTFNVNRKINNFKDYFSDIESEKEELSRIKRQTKPNSKNSQQFIGNPKTKYNKVTHKLDTNLDPEIIDDKIAALEELKMYETTIDYDIYHNIIKSHGYRNLVEKFREAISSFEDDISSLYDDGNNDHIAALKIAIQDALDEAS
jgi:hypothetical protein